MIAFVSSNISNILYLINRKYTRNICSFYQILQKKTPHNLHNGTKLRLIKRLLYYSKNSIEVFFSTIFIKQLTSIQKYAAALATDMII